MKYQSKLIYFIKRKCIWNVVWKIAAILFRPQCVKCRRFWSRSATYTEIWLLWVPTCLNSSGHPVHQLSRGGVTKPIPSFPLFSEFFSIVKKHVSYWISSSYLTGVAGDTCQIWMWCKESKKYFCEIENFVHGEINERNFSNPHTRSPFPVSFVFY